jgi:hypothetical protein
MSVRGCWRDGQQCKKTKDRQQRRPFDDNIVFPCLKVNKQPELHDLDQIDAKNFYRNGSFCACNVTTWGKLRKGDSVAVGTLVMESPIIVVSGQQELHIAWRSQSSCRCCVSQSVRPVGAGGFRAFGEAGDGWNELD